MRGTPKSPALSNYKVLGTSCQASLACGEEIVLVNVPQFTIVHCSWLHSLGDRCFSINLLGHFWRIHQRRYLYGDWWLIGFSTCSTCRKFSAQKSFYLKQSHCLLVYCDDAFTNITHKIFVDVSVLRAVLTEYHRLGGLQTTEIYSHHSGGWKSNMVGFWWWLPFRL